MTTRTVGGESFQVERRGDIAVVTPSPAIEQMPENLVEQAAQMVLSPLREEPPNGLIVDLCQVNYFGSVFISFLLRCHLLVKKQGAELVLAGVSDRVRELLRLTSLDTLWALYATKTEALEALSGSD
jgi:anti-sigma B factor antagonist